MRSTQTVEEGVREEGVRAERRTDAGALKSVTAFLSAYRVPIAAFVVHLILVFAVAAYAIGHFYALEPVAAIQFRLPPLTGIEHYLVQPLRNWDGFWYSLIAGYGYGIYDASAAFWPLYPLLLRVGSELTGWQIPVVGIVLSNVAFLFALGVLYRLVRIDYSAAIARRTIWLTILFPTSYYFSAVYTESLFLLVTVAAVYYARTDRWGRAALMASLAALTRNTGVLILLPVGLLLVKKYGWDPRRWWQQGIQLGLAALSPLLFFAYLDRLWGDPLLPLKVQKGWARYKAMPWQTLQAAFHDLDLSWLHALIQSPSWSTLTNPNVRLIFAEKQSYDVFIFLVFVPLIAYTLWRIRPAYSLYALLVFVLPLFTPSLVHPLMSIPRFVIVLFPFFIAMALLLRNRWLYGTVLALFLIQFVGLLIQFSTWYWVA